MSDSDSDRSSDYEPESFRDLKAADVVLSQMRRGAQKRGGQSKLKARYEGLQSYGEMMKAHALKRMQDGLRKLLSLHSATELSSICGCLHLKVQQKGSTSIEMILKYASETEEMNDEKIHKILKFMWEGALWEYLHSIGHPVHSMLPDPKLTILKIWEEGGLLEGGKTLIPHFIAREVKKRYEWVQAEDIRTRLDKLRVAQEAAKYAERKVVSEHDYTNILTYFNQMSALRTMENSTREYLIAELEIARSRVDSSIDTAKMQRDQIAESERYFISVAEALNEKLAYAEFTAETLMKERYMLERDLQRLCAILDSYADAQKDRETPGGGSVCVHVLKEEEKCDKTVRVLHRKLQRYHVMCCDADDALRVRSRSHIEEVERLEGVIRDMEEELSDRYDDIDILERRAERAEKELQYCARRLTKLEIRGQMSVDQSWAAMLRCASRVNNYGLRLRRIKPLLVAGLQHKTNAVLSDVCQALLTQLPVFTDRDEENLVMESHLMLKEESASRVADEAYRTSLSMFLDTTTESAAASLTVEKKPVRKPGSSQKGGSGSSRGRAGVSSSAGNNNRSRKGASSSSTGRGRGNGTGGNMSDSDTGTVRSKTTVTSNGSSSKATTNGGGGGSKSSKTNKSDKTNTNAATVRPPSTPTPTIREKPSSAASSGKKPSVAATSPGKKSTGTPGSPAKKKN